MGVINFSSANKGDHGGKYTLYEPPDIPDNTIWSCLPFRTQRPDGEDLRKRNCDRGEKPANLCLVAYPFSQRRILSDHTIFCFMVAP